MTNTWCVLPWVHLCVRPNEQIKPCCRFQYDEGAAESAPNLDNFDPNNEYWTQLRQDMLDGTPRTECRKCYEQESVLQGHKRNQSLRHWMNSLFEDIGPDDCGSDFRNMEYIEMSIDNLCNFECRMCDSKFSSKLQTRDQSMGWRVHKKLEPDFTKFDRYDISNLRYIKLLGGEPLISPNFTPFLSYIKERGASYENIRLQISTNGSRPISDKLLKILNCFRFVEINVSLDAYDSINDYQRIGGYYEMVYKNALWYQENIVNSHVNFHTVVSVYTASKLGKTLEFLVDENEHDVSVDWVRDPLWQSLLIAPPAFVDWVLEQNQDHEFASKLIKNFVKNSEYDKRAWKNLLNNTERLDKYHNRYLNKYDPALYKQLYGEI